MKKISSSDIFPTGLAIFSMLFGGGNLMYPIAVGMQSGSLIAVGLIGFIMSGVVLPLVGLIGMLLFDGNIDAFFNRLGKTTGQLLLGTCMLVVGPIIVIPRIVSLSYTMMSPFLPRLLLETFPTFSVVLFSIIFLGLTFLAAFRENKIIAILGHFISPALLLSLGIIITKGILTATDIIPNNSSSLIVFGQSFKTGYETLDLLGAIFFSSMILHILKNSLGSAIDNNKRLLAAVSLKAGIIGISLLGIIYIGMGFLGAYHGHNLMHVHPDILFREISFKVMGNYGALVIGIAVLMACLSTSIALSAVVAEYIEKKVFTNTISFVTALALVLIASLPLSIAGLGSILKITGGPLLYIGYPVIITLTICNILFKLYDFKSVKLPVFITFVATTIGYIVTFVL